ncbi:hypothetical protein ALO43_200017 [Pseudomonas tremae]|uniref:O-methyl transferase n=1 Tax=Pseudomonas tremae TaxID=200454 RepID=A0AA40TV55_9PSED|nr:hypothetical protein ALO43_200017 [Pseudomonas tremae]
MTSIFVLVPRTVKDRPPQRGATGYICLTYPSTKAALRCLPFPAVHDWPAFSACNRSMASFSARRDVVANALPFMTFGVNLYVVHSPVQRKMSAIYDYYHGPRTT